MPPVVESYLTSPSMHLMHQSKSPIVHRSHGLATCNPSQPTGQGLGVPVGRFGGRWFAEDPLRSMIFSGRSCSISCKAETMASRSYPYFCANASRLRQTSSRISFFMVADLQEFERGAYLRTDVSILCAYRPNHRLGNRIVNMAAIPRQQDIDAVNRCHCNVKCIGFRLVGQSPSLHQDSGKITNLVGYLQFRDGLETTRPLSGCLRITGGRLGQNQSRGIKLKAKAILLPPGVCRLLTRCDKQIATRFARQIAHDRCFDIDSPHAVIVRISR